MRTISCTGPIVSEILTPEFGFEGKNGRDHQYLDPCFPATSGPKWTNSVSLERELAKDSKYIIVFHTEMY